MLTCILYLGFDLFLSLSCAVRASDIWALGVTLFFTLSGGRHPFRGTAPLGTPEHVSSTMEKIQRGVLEHLPDNVSNEAQDILRCMLQPDSRLRMTSSQLLAHPWINMQEEVDSTCAAGAATVMIQKQLNAFRNMILPKKMESSSPPAING